MRSLFLLFLFLLGATSSADRYGSDYGNQSLSGLNTVSALMDYAGKAKTPASFVAALPDPYLSSPTFVYLSQSLQKASYHSPRALLSDASGNLVLAFHGESETIEAMEFDEPTARFSFYEINFTNGAAHASPPNPAECLICHRGPDPRPNWESYDFWPGVYGSKDDRLDEPEVQPFKTFLTGIDGRPGYGALKIGPLKKGLTYTSHYGRLPEEPNISFTHRLSKNNYQRVARLITESAEYEKYKYTIVAFLSGGDNERFNSESYLPKNSSPIGHYYSPAQIAEAQALAQSITVNADVAGALTFRSLFESRGIDTSDWFLNFSGGLTNTFINGVSWEAQLLEALLARDPSLKALLYPGSSGQFDAGKLLDASGDAFGEETPPVPLHYATDPEVPGRIWNHSCRQCHEGRAVTVAPQFGFAEALKKKTFATLIQSGTMPPNRILAPSEKVALLGRAQKSAR